MNAATAAENNGFRYWLPVLCLILIPLAVYGRVLGGSFLAYDDRLHVSENPNLGKSASVIRFWQAPYAGLYMPVTYTLWAAQYRLFQKFTDPQSAAFASAFHGVSLILHIVNTLLVFWIFRGLGISPWPAALGALLFALHPVQVACVSWISAFKQLCGAFFSLAAIRLCLCPRAGVFTAATAAYGLAILSLPMYVGTLVMMAAVTWMTRARRLPWLLTGCLVWGVMALGISCLALTAEGGLPRMWDADWLNRIRVGGDTLAFYAIKVCFPLSIAADYGRTPIMVLSSHWGILLSVAGWIGLIVLLVCVKSRVARVGTAIFITGLAPVLGLVPFYYQSFSTVANRFMYLAMLGPALGMAWWMQCRDRAKIPAVLMAAGFAAISFMQCGYWKNDLSLAMYTLLINPQSRMANNHLAIALAQAERYELAKEHFSRVLDVYPRSLPALINMGNVFIRQQRYAEALPFFLRAIREDPDNFSLRFALANLFAQTSRHREALEQYQFAHHLRPDEAEVYDKLALLYGQMGKPQKAARCRQKEAELRQEAPYTRPDDPPNVDIRPDEP